MTNSYLTQTTREWLEKKREKLPFRIHEMDGKLLKARLLAFPDLMIKYFFSDRGMAIAEMLKLWVLYDMLPDAKSFYSTMKKVEPEKLKIEHLVFLLYCGHILSDELERYCEDQEQEELNDKMLLPAIVQNIGDSKSVFTDDELTSLHILPHFLGQSSSFQQNSDKRTFFLREKYKGHFLLELYLGKHNQKLDCKTVLRRIKKI